MKEQGTSFTGKVVVYLPKANEDFEFPMAKNKADRSKRIFTVTPVIMIPSKLMYDVASHIKKNITFDDKGYVWKFFQVEMKSTTSSSYLQRIRIYVNRIQAEHPEAYICFVKEYGHEGIYTFTTTVPVYSNRLTLVQ